MNIFDKPLVVFAVTLLAQWLAAYFGDFCRRRWWPVRDDKQQDVDIVQGALFTLLALIIGFSFSMAVSRYDQRKNYEEAEANAIGTEYVRADLLPAADAARLRSSLKSFLDLRLAFYTGRRERPLGRIDPANERLSAELWSTVLPPAHSQPTVISGLVVSGANDVLNAEGYTQAAWWNRIPIAAWVLMGVIAISCNLLHGYSERQKGPFLLLVVPIVISISFLLIAELDSPRGGVIRVHPNNLLALSRSIGAH